MVFVIMLPLVVHVQENPPEGQHLYGAPLWGRPDSTREFGQNKSLDGDK